MCLVICTTALVRVEIINRRVHHLKDVMAEVRQTYDSINDTNDASSLKNISKEGKGAMKGIPLTLRFVLNHQLHYQGLILKCSLCFLLNSVYSRSVYEQKVNSAKMRSVSGKTFHLV